MLMRTVETSVISAFSRIRVAFFRALRKIRKRYEHFPHRFSVQRGDPQRKAFLILQEKFRFRRRLVPVDPRVQKRQIPVLPGNRHRNAHVCFQHILAQKGVFARNAAGHEPLARRIARPLAVKVASQKHPPVLTQKLQRFLIPFALEAVPDQIDAAYRPLLKRLLHSAQKPPVQKYFFIVLRLFFPA